MTKSKVGDKILSAKMQRIPMLNLRMEFKTYYKFLENAVKNGLEVTPVIRSPYMIWSGMPNDFFSIILQRAIVGVEAYVPSAVWETMMLTGKFKPTYMKYIKNPFNIKGKGSLPEKFYNRLPSFVHPDMALKVMDKDIWEIVDKFYKNIRNPLFHGNLIGDIKGPIVNPEIVLDGFDVINEIYYWVDTWSNLENLWAGANCLHIEPKQK